MRIFFYLPSLELGGAQTFVYRACRILGAEHDLAVVYSQQGSAIELIGSVASTYQVSATGDWASDLLAGGPGTHVFLNHECIYWWANSRHLLTSGNRVLAYVLGPGDFQAPGWVGSLIPRISGASVNFFARLPGSGRIFMNDYYRRLGMGPGAIEGEGEVLPLPVDLSSGERVRRVPVRGRVVSVGRLVAMKQYHGGVFRYLRNEKAAGRPASYVIIGDGPLRDALREQARRIGVADMVEFSGEVSYARLADYYQDPWCFVGMGTSAVEAASAGIPVVLANMLDTDGRSPGLLSTMPGFQLGDDLGLPTRPLEDLLAEVMGMSAAKYRTVVAAHRSHVARFTASEILAGMVELCLQAPEFLPQSIPGNWARRGSAVWRGIRRLAGRS